MENIPQVPGNRAELGQNHNARKEVSATYYFSLKVRNGCISAQKLETERSKIFLRPFHIKPRSSGVTLESLGLENIAKILENRAEVAQNHDARKAVSPTLSVLK